MRSAIVQDILPEYGKNACYAATFSRQLPRITKHVEAFELHTRTRVQFPPSPKRKRTSVEVLFLFNEFSFRKLACAGGGISNRGKFSGGKLAVCWNFSFLNSGAVGILCFENPRDEKKLGILVIYSFYYKY